MNERSQRVLRRIIAREDKTKARRCIQAAIAAFVLGEDGNAYLHKPEIQNGKFNKFSDRDDFGMYWGIPSMMHLYARFGNKLNEKNKKAIADILTNFYYTFGWVALNSDGRCERMYLSENHDSLVKNNMYLLTVYMPELLSKPLRGIDARDAARLLERNVSKSLDSIIKDGWLIEGGEPYNAVTIESIYNIMELAKDKEIKEKAKKIVDLFWLFHAQETINGVRGYARARVYPYWRDNTSGWVSSLFGAYTDVYGVCESGEIDYLVSYDYQLPKAVYDIMTSREEMMPYTVKTRQRGGGYYILEKHKEEEVGMPQTPIYYLDNYAKVIKNTYVTKNYTVSGFSYPLRQPRLLIASQFLWEGITWAEPKGMSVCAAVHEKDGAFFDSFVTFSHKDRIIYAKNKNAYVHIPGDGGVDIINADDKRYNYSMQICITGTDKEISKEYINENLIIFRCDNCMFSAETDNGFEEKDGNVIVLSQKLILTASSLKEESMEQFVNRVTKQKNCFLEERIISSDGVDEMEFNFNSDSERIRILNGEIPDTNNIYTCSPFVNAMVGDGIYKIETEQQGGVM